ncbi:MAG: ATP-binding cassette domain-containing protein [Candidatus Electryonea clarkiae]|nr:ATP-binding cassette domain-containing protein [Candidatus Electryonea clarkiae]MDP8289130.1 ATP-binding cassette domain-containing protein [Candidatus Electryonea clarkiae]
MIKTSNLTKIFEDRKRGKIVAVNHLNLSVNDGEIFGLLGTNGAGKTTTLRMLVTVFKPTEGTAEVAGFDILENPDDVRKNIGFLSGDTNLYARLTAREVIEYYGGLHGMSRINARARVDELAEMLDLNDFLHQKIAKLSTGQKQRVSIARAIVHQPDLMIFDEPTAGLDPISAKSILDFIRSCRSDSKTVLFSTHYLREAETLCDRIGILHDGELKAIGTLEEILDQTDSTNLEHAFYTLAGLEIQPD